MLCGTPAILADNIACLEVMDFAVSKRFSRLDSRSITAALTRCSRVVEFARHVLRSRVCIWRITEIR